jgi:hypothetical protein
MGDLGAACMAGYRKCAEGTARAKQVRRLGTLPVALAFGCCDIGEAYVEYPDGDTGYVLITWGRHLRQGEQNWHIDNSRFQPVWTGSEDGRAELILCPSHSDNKLYRWLRAGMRLVDDQPKWECVPKEDE